MNGSNDKNLKSLLAQSSKNTDISGAGVDVPRQTPAAAADAAQRQPSDAAFKLEIFSKLYADLPIISTSFDLTANIYKSVRRSNCISHCMLKTFEETAGAVKNSNNPIVNIVFNPLMRIDHLLCATLDFLEEKVPQIKMTPAEMYDSTKSMVIYVCTGRCAFDCVCKTGRHSLNTANKLKNMVLCKQIDDNAVRFVDNSIPSESFQDAFKEMIDNINDPTSPYHQPFVPLMPNYRLNN